MLIVRCLYAVSTVLFLYPFLAHSAVTSRAFFATPPQFKIPQQRFARQQPPLQTMPVSPSPIAQKPGLPSAYRAKKFTDFSLFGKQPFSQTILNKPHSGFCPTTKAFFSIKAGQWAEQESAMTAYLAPDLVNSFKNGIALTLKQLTPSTLLGLIKQMRSWQREQAIEKVQKNPRHEDYFLVKAFENPQTIATLLQAFPRVLVDTYSYEVYATFLINFLYTHFHDSFLKALDVLPSDSVMHAIVGQILVEENLYQNDKDFERHPGAALALLKGLARQQRILFGVMQKPSLTPEERAIARQKLADQKNEALLFAKTARLDAKNEPMVASLLNVFGFS